MNYWFILGILAFIAAANSLFIGKNAIWGGLFIGFVAAAIYSILKMIEVHSFPLDAARKIITIATLAGAFFEICSRISSRMMGK